MAAKIGSLVHNREDKDTQSKTASIISPRSSAKSFFRKTNQTFDATEVLGSLVKTINDTTYGRASPVNNSSVKDILQNTFLRSSMEARIHRDQADQQAKIHRRNFS